MPDWLKWKKNKLLKPKATEPVPFEINCVCGRLAAGNRSQRYQQVICLDCGEPLFVLPLNPYPAPQPGHDRPTGNPSGEANTKTASRQKSRAGATIGEQADSPETKSSKKPIASPKVRAKSKGKTKPVAPSKPRPDAVPLSKMKRPKKRVITPFRMTLVAIGGILAATIFYSIKSSKADNAEFVMREAAAGGFEALAEDNMIGAAIEFRKAAEAAAIVAPDSTQAATLRQMQLETEVVTRLSDESLIDIIMRATEAAEQQPTNWQQSFVLSDDWIVIDSNVKKSIGADGGEVAAIEFPVSIGNATINVICNADAFAPMSLSGTYQRIIFAAQVKSIDFQTSPPKWQLTLESSSILLWSNEKLFAAAGFKTDDSEWDTQAAQQLAKQKQKLGIDE